MDAKKNDCDEVKLRNLGDDDDAATKDGEPIGLVHDLIHLTHLHEPAILHSLRLRYDGDVIYTSTGPILIAINPFKKMENLYGESVMEEYRRAGEGNGSVLCFSIDRSGWNNLICKFLTLCLPHTFLLSNLIANHSFALLHSNNLKLPKLPHHKCYRPMPTKPPMKPIAP